MYCSLKQPMMIQAMNTVVANEEVSLSNGQLFKGRLEGKISSDLLNPNASALVPSVKKTTLLNQSSSSNLCLLA